VNNFFDETREEKTLAIFLNSKNSGKSEKTRGKVGLDLEVN